MHRQLVQRAVRLAPDPTRPAAARARSGAALALAAVALCALLPRPVAAADAPRRGVDWGGLGISPAESALTGGVVVLRSPGARMIRVPRSSFMMGSTVEDVLNAVADCAREPLGQRCREEMFSDELPAHRVTVSSFWLDRTEVTVADYRRCVALRRCRAIPFAEGARRFDRPKLPATLVRYRDARAYCRFRGARLPTEAEFERAARGTASRQYPWGDLYHSRAANHGRLGLDATDDRDGYAELAPVGSFPAGRTPDGFLDLAGNAAEWIEDRYNAPYPDEPAVDPTGPAAASSANGRVVRGGHFGSGAAWLRGAARGNSDPESRDPHLGFRCALGGAATRQRSTVP